MLSSLTEVVLGTFFISIPTAIVVFVLLKRSRFALKIRPIWRRNIICTVLAIAVVYIAYAALALAFGIANS